MAPRITVPQWKLRRVAPRALDVLARHRGQAPILDHFQETLAAAVNRFTASYDASRGNTPSTRELNEGKQAIAELRTTLRTWLGLIARDVPGFSAPSFDVRTPIPDDLMGSARRLLELLQGARSGGAPLPYAASAAEKIAASLAHAEKEWREGQGELAAHQSALAEVREAARALHKELVAFRRTLAVVLGPQHRDYRALRTARSTTELEEDETDEVEVVDEPEEEEEPAEAPPLPSAPAGAGGAAAS